MNLQRISLRKKLDPLGERVIIWGSKVEILAGFKLINGKLVRQETLDLENEKYEAVEVKGTSPGSAEVQAERQEGGGTPETASGFVDVVSVTWQDSNTGQDLAEHEIVPPETVSAKFANEPGQPGGAGGFGGPPSGSGFETLVSPFRIDTLTVSDGGTSPDGMALTLASNVTDWEQLYELTETSVGSAAFVEPADTLAVRIVEHSAHDPQEKDTMILAVSSVAFGTIRTLKVYESDVDSETYNSRVLHLSVTMSALPDPAQVDSVDATLATNLRALSQT